MKNTNYTRLQRAIENKQAKLGVVGLGYVGLPLAVEMVKQGFSVYGIDLDERKIESLRRGESYVQDISREKLGEALAGGRFQPTSDYSKVAELDAVSICVPTPLSANQDPDTSYIVYVVNQLKHYMKKGLLIVLESTTYPGTTEELIEAELAQMGLVAGKDYFLCFSPERVDPGSGTFATYNTPKVLGGTTPECGALGKLLYENIVEKVVPVSSTKVAEMSKLLENTFRSVNIAFINEMAMMCERMSIDIWEVIEAASTKPFGFMPFYPGPGIGGHCIPLDPMYLAWKAKGYRFYSSFIELAQSVNSNMPYHVVTKTANILNQSAKSLRNSRILILGMAYKPNVDDLRESPGLEAYELYRKEGAIVDYYDPFATSFRDHAGETVRSVPYNLDQFRGYDCFVLITDHAAFPYRELAGLGVPILDTRNALSSFDLPHIFKLGAPADRPMHVMHTSAG
ncbi:nucleotide sugar dehydrogenase [Cohnella thailandensis]|uniref:Nucleotide sugar dehydrogenase n=1 Tax=Cohnella thailandensis TaxID=557557 RepID=A0A841SR17_9BACL|nr:nucleotide sugar dehydrogenase [Cohnella thailandensis]MBB6634853.1 nucleotide sugar dehydrogenase [Cohnella thailandensis]MBP1975925.1 UDP-N-acetyl-D-glucosamine dehydrogenase [Cohnella thailandensis]